MCVSVSVSLCAYRHVCVCECMCVHACVCVSVSLCVCLSLCEHISINMYAKPYSTLYFHEICLRTEMIFQLKKNLTEDKREYFIPLNTFFPFVLLFVLIVFYLFWLGECI